MTPPERPSRRDVLRATAGISGSLAFPGIAGGDPGGTFSASDPTEITTAAGLEAIRDDLDGAYVLADDVDLSGVSNFEPIGGRRSPFTGTFDGNDHMISGLTIDRPDQQAVGLFGVVEPGPDRTGGSIRNVTLDGVDVTGGSKVGALVGFNDGSVTGAGVSGTVAGTSSVGGLIGETGGCVYECHSEATVTGVASIGGLVGEAYRGYIGDSDTTSSVTGEFKVGGLIGQQTGGHINNADTTGDVTGTGDRPEVIGGLIGEATGRVSGSTAQGAVSGFGEVGGLIGDGSFAIVDRSTAEGDVTGNSTVGGLVGRSGVIVDSVAAGAVDGWSAVGGLAGEGGTALRSHATGDVEGNGGIGGLIGSGNDVFVSRSSATGDVIGVGDSDGDDDPPFRAGGLIGHHKGGSVSESFATGRVSAAWNVGGLVGVIQDFAYVTESYATGSVSASEKIAGGLVGKNIGQIIESYATGAVSGGGLDAGGLVGRNRLSDNDDFETVVADSYWDTDATGLATAIGTGPGGTTVTGLTTSQMQGSAAEDSMEALDFAGTWDTATSPGDYPTLAWDTRLNWRFETGDRIIGSPTVVDGTAFIAPDPKFGCNPTVYAVDVETGRQEWAFQLESDTTGTFQSNDYLAGGLTGAVDVADGTAFLQFLGGEIVAVDAATGEKQWRTEMEGSSGGGFNSSTVYEDTVFCRDGRGWLYWFDVDTGERKRRIRLGGSTPVTVVDGMLYATSGGELVAVNTETGDVEWQFQGITSNGVSSPTVADDTVYVNSVDSLVAVDAVTGRQEWKYEPGDDIDGIRSSPTVADDTVYVNSGGSVLAVDVQQGELRWTYQSDGSGAHSSPTVVEDTVFVGGYVDLDPPARGYPRPVRALVALDAATGDLKWWFDATPYSMASSSPTVVDGVVYVGSTGGFLYALDADVEGSSQDSRVMQRTLGHHDRGGGEPDPSTTLDVTGDGNPARDPDGDGTYEDVNGDGDVTPGDSTVLFNAVFERNPTVFENPDAFDFNGDGSVTAGDAIVLFNRIFGG